MREIDEIIAGLKERASVTGDKCGLRIEFASPFWIVYAYAAGSESAIGVGFTPDEAVSRFNRYDAVRAELVVEQILRRYQMLKPIELELYHNYTKIA